jgi:hypothetical protein
MKSKIEGRYCLVKKEKENKKAKIIKSFIQVGGEDHQEHFVALVLEDPSLCLWEREIICKFKYIKLLD